MANYVAVQIIAPQAEGDTGASAEAWYVVEGNEVVLTDRDGVALFECCRASRTNGGQSRLIRFAKRTSRASSTACALFGWVDRSTVAGGHAAFRFDYRIAQSHRTKRLKIKIPTGALRR